MADAVTLAVGTRITGEGIVVRRTVSRLGLHTAVIATRDQYPDIEVWLELLKAKDVRLHHYSERVIVDVFTGYLWLFWKEDR